jgi:hypothetical protein
MIFFVLAAPGGKEAVPLAVAEAPHFSSEQPFARFFL